MLILIAVIRKLLLVMLLYHHLHTHYKTLPVILVFSVHLSMRGAKVKVKAAAV